MKINHYIYALAGAALMLFGMAACSPDDYDLGDKDVTPADLVEGQAYTITQHRVFEESDGRSLSGQLD